MTSRRAFCFDCDRETGQRLVSATNGGRPVAETWRCGRCGVELLSLADVTDAFGLCATIAKKSRSGSTEYGDVKAGERDELLAELRCAVWQAYGEWDPAQCRFRAYAATKLRQAAINWDRDRRGRVDQGRPPKPLSIAVSLDAPTLEPDGRDETWLDRLGAEDDRLRPAEPALSLDDRPDSLADLRRAVSRRGRELAEEDRKMGREAAA